MKFSEMPYKRPDLDELKQKITAVAERMEQAADLESARSAALEMDTLDRHIQTLADLVQIRHSIDTRDPFYDGEKNFWNAAMPELAEYAQRFNKALLESPFRPELEAEFGEIVFLDMELEVRSFAPELIPAMQEENDCVTEYTKLIASAQIPFEGGVYTIAQMTPFKNDPDDARRLAAWQAEGQWYKDHQADLDRIYDRLVHLRD